MTPSSEEKYLTALVSEKEKIIPYIITLPICAKLLDNEIFRVQSSLGVLTDPLNYLLSPKSQAGIIKLQEKVPIPVDKYPQYNFIGRILGPKGMSLKRIEVATRCKIMIRGKGSMRDKDKEEGKKGKPGFEHLLEPLHVLIEAEMEEALAIDSVKKAKEIIEKLLIPVGAEQDFIKKNQLRELALMKTVYHETNVSSKFSFPSTLSFAPLSLTHSQPVLAHFKYDNNGNEFHSNRKRLREPLPNGTEYFYQINPPRDGASFY